jgi:imidazoleglycerol phosphate dehydratase HisB
MLWETEEEDIARRLGEALEKCSQALERVKAQLPHDELHRLEFARSCVNQVFHGGEADADQAAMEVRECQPARYGRAQVPIDELMAHVPIDELIRAAAAG